MYKSCHAYNNLVCLSCRKAVSFLNYVIVPVIKGRDVANKKWENIMYCMLTQACVPSEFEDVKNTLFFSWLI